LGLLGYYIEIYDGFTENILKICYNPHTFCRACHLGLLARELPIPKTSGDTPVIDPTVYLTATDTTVGFISQDADRLDAIKGRPAHKYYIVALPSLRALRSKTRIPLRHRNRVRRARRTTFVLPDGRSWRVIHDPRHRRIIQELGWAYTTSANRSGGAYDEVWAREKADGVIEPLEANAPAPSTILKISKARIRKLR